MPRSNAIILTIVPAIALLLGGSALATDGVLEINQTCAVNTGCFSGDSAGFPVEIDGTAGLSYRLTGDLQVPNENTTGISISVDAISVDLNGFAIRGGTNCLGSPTTCAPLGTGVGVAVASNPLRQGIEVRNGIVTGMGNAGLALGVSARVDNVRALENGGIGIGTSNGSVVVACTAQRNGGDGISAGRGSTISTSAASSNGGNGISGDVSTTVSTSAAAFNGGHGISVASQGNVVDNSAYSNDDAGISASTGSVVRGNSAVNNSNQGIDGFRDMVVSGNSTYGNGDGEATDDGILCDSGCLVEHNASANNDGFGIRLSGATSGYRANVTRNNTGGAVSGGTDLGNNLLN